MGLFKTLANDTRLRLLHALARAGELCVVDLAETICACCTGRGAGDHPTWLKPLSAGVFANT